MVIGNLYALIVKTDMIVKRNKQKQDWGLKMAFSHKVIGKIIGDKKSKNLKPIREKMDDGSTWYSCSKCGAAHENKKDAKECCKEE
jgi:hypothetical protein